MRRIRIFEMPSLYREPMVITGYRFGKGEKSAAIVGAMRGNEIQQLYICSQLVRRLKTLEQEGLLTVGHAVEVIPCVNPSSVNIGKRFWAMDDTDVNRMFPGYDKGETTQRIASGLFQHLIGWKWGIQFASFYLRGDFVPHVRMMSTDWSDAQTACDFGLPYVFVREPLPIDTTTLNYNWQIWDTRAYTILTSETDRIDVVSAEIAVNSVLRFLVQGVLSCQVPKGVPAQQLRDDDILNVHAAAAGIFRCLVKPGDLVCKDDLLGEIIDPGQGHVLREVRSHGQGCVFFACRDALVMQRQILFGLKLAADQTAQ
mgnify:FL=1